MFILLHFVRIVTHSVNVWRIYVFKHQTQLSFIFVIFFQILDSVFSSQTLAKPHLARLFRMFFYKIFFLVKISGLYMSWYTLGCATDSNRPKQITDRINAIFCLERSDQPSLKNIYILFAIFIVEAKSKTFRQYEGQK